MTKDATGICFPDLNLGNASTIDQVQVYKNRSMTYFVNGVPIHGWFPVDFSYKDLEIVYLKQNLYSRIPYYDGLHPILKVKDVDDLMQLDSPRQMWLNIQYDAFYSQHNLSMRNFVIATTKSGHVKYISSPEPPTSLVLDAHKEGLEVFTSDFMNDVPFAYNYSYDPVLEYLSFVENGKFSVDGVLSDNPVTPSAAFVMTLYQSMSFVENGKFSVDGVLSDNPVTPSAAFDCYSHMGTNQSQQAKVLIISSEGASGDFPGCTDLAYKKAVSDGADIIDCPVQMTSDGVPICVGSINLTDRTTVAISEFSNLSSSFPELQSGNGIYTFSLTWSQIKSLRPTMFNPYAKIILLLFLWCPDQHNACSLPSKISRTKQITEFANSVIISKESIYPKSNGYLYGQTDVVPKLQASKLRAYVQKMSNDFISIPWDFFTDPYVEINTYVTAAGVDGVASRYRRNKCLSLSDEQVPNYARPAEPGRLFEPRTPTLMPPAEAPSPVLNDSDLASPPIPPTIERPHPSPHSGDESPASTPASTSSQSPRIVNIILSFILMVVGPLLMY
nr:glycerophosphodiester phosphodiesterase GDPDL3-like [Tanacetum cinerariifolium]